MTHLSNLSCIGNMGHCFCQHNTGGQPTCCRCQSVQRFYGDTLTTSVTPWDPRNNIVPIEHPDPTLLPVAEARDPLLQIAALVNAYRNDWLDTRTADEIVQAIADVLGDPFEPQPAADEPIDLLKIRDIVKRMRTHGTAGQRIVKRWADEIEDAAFPFKAAASCAPRTPAEPEGWIERRLREEWWAGHGCPFAALYGDDGEMQCNAATCHRDFKREPMEVLRKHVDERRLMRVSEALSAAQPLPPSPAEKAPTR